MDRSPPPPAEPPLSGEGRHVLVVDDDEEFRKLLLSLLRRNGFRASGARDGTEMRALLAAAAVDVVLLDVMLPGPSGFELCREVAAEGQVPVVLLTARADTSDRVLGLEFGADDYVTKPAEPRELVARLRAVLRRAEGGGGRAGESRREVARFGGWSLDVRRRRLLSPRGAVVDLTSGEHDLLLAFVERPQRVLSRDQLLDAARNRAFGGLDRSMDVQVSRLRAKLDAEAGAGGAGLIKTVRGAGYVLVADVAWD